MKVQVSSSMRVERYLRLLLKSLEEQIIDAMTWLVLSLEGTEIAVKHKIELLELHALKQTIEKRLEPRNLYSFLKYSLN